MVAKDDLMRCLACLVLLVGLPQILCQSWAQSHFNSQWTNFFPNRPMNTTSNTQLYPPVTFGTIIAQIVTPGYNPPSYSAGGIPVVNENGLLFYLTFDDWGAIQLQAYNLANQKVEWISNVIEAVSLNGTGYFATNLVLDNNNGMAYVVVSYYEDSVNSTFLQNLRFLRFILVFFAVGSNQYGKWQSSMEERIG